MTTKSKISSKINGKTASKVNPKSTCGSFGDTFLLCWMLKARKRTLESGKLSRTGGPARLGPQPGNVGPLHGRLAREAPERRCSNIGGWGVSPTGKSYSFRSCVRASEAACGRETTLLPFQGSVRSFCAPGRGWGVPFPCVVPRFFAS